MQDKSEERMPDYHKLLMSCMTEGVALHEMIWDEDGNPVDYRFLEVNPAFEKLLNKKRDELIGKTVKEVFPETEQYWIDTYADVVKSGISIHFEHEALRGDTKYYYEVVAVRPSPGWFACVFQDISRHRTIEVELTQSQNRLDGLLRTVPTGVIVADADGVIRYANDKASEILELPKNELVDYSLSHARWQLFDEFGAPLDRMSYPALKALQTGKPVSNRMCRLDCTYTQQSKWLLISSEPILYDGDEKAREVVTAFIDLTEMRHSAAALRENEKLLRDIINLVPNTIFAHDIDGRLLLANQALARLFNAKPEDIVGRVYSDIPGVNGLVRSEFLKEDRDIIEQKLSVHIPEELVVDRDGKAHYQEVYKIPIDIRDVPAVLGVGIDITDRKNATDRLRLESTILELLNQGGDPVRRIQRVLEYVREEFQFDIIAMRLKDGEEYPCCACVGVDVVPNHLQASIYHETEDGCPVLDDAGERCIAGLCGRVITGAVSELLRSYVTRHGSFWTNEASSPRLQHALERQGAGADRSLPVDFESMAFIPLKNEGTVLGLLQVYCSRPGRLDMGLMRYLEGLSASMGVAIARQLDQAALRSSRQRFDYVLDATNDAIWDLNVEKGTAYFSPKYFTMLGYEPDEFASNYDGWRSLLHPDDAIRAENAMQQHLDGVAESYEQEFRLREKSGEWRWILGRGKVIERDDAGRPLRMVGTHMDITERKKSEQERQQLEAQLRQAQKLEAIGTLAGGIAHDFNNILYAIQGYTELSMLDVEDNEEVSGYLREVTSAAGRASDLVKQILAFSRQTEQKMAPMQLQPIIKEVLKLLRSTLPANIEISSEIKNSDLLIHADPTQIHQILMNLCTNAFHAMQPQGGVLRVSLNAVEVSKYSEINASAGHYLVLSVADSGVGMTQDVLDRMYEPYFTTKAPGQGSGLGLSVVHSIVKAHGGVVRAVSRPGEGTCFSVYLPVMAQAAEADSKTTTDPIVQNRGGRVMIVDDEDAVRSINQRSLSWAGFEVTAFATGTEALEQFSKNSAAYDVVVTDLSMPKMNGLEMAQQMRVIRPDLAIVLCTGYGSEAIQEKAAQAGIRIVIQKPTPIRTFISTVRDAYEKKSAAKKRSGE